jgi:hypothetical protein
MPTPGYCLVPDLTAPFAAHYSAHHDDNDELDNSSLLLLPGGDPLPSHQQDGVRPVPCQFLTHSCPTDGCSRPSTSVHEPTDG